jgi:carbon starvation protein CstA
VGFIITKIDFAIIWRYMAWSNQTLATIVLWAITVYLFNERKAFFITLIPSVFMTAVISVYLLAAPEGFMLPLNTSYTIGFIFTLLVLGWFITYVRKSRQAERGQSVFQ